MDQVTFMNIFNVIVVIVLIGLLGYLVFYIVELLKPILRILKNISAISERFKREQEFIDRILFHSGEAVENIEETLRTIENAVGAFNGVKEFWQKKRKERSEAKGNAHE